MSAFGDNPAPVCLKCGEKDNWPVCKSCGYERKTPFLSVETTPKIEFEHSSYADWLKSKNIYVWIKDKR